MQVHDLAPAPGAKKNAKRVGRGTGGKGGKTAGRGSKGQRARNTVARGFEGGQTPLKQRVPKLKGFNNPFRVEYQAVNLTRSCTGRQDRRRDGRPPRCSLPTVSCGRSRS
jgi:large subunit ribosomal protein L15